MYKVNHPTFAPPHKMPRCTVRKAASCCEHVPLVGPDLPPCGSSPVFSGFQHAPKYSTISGLGTTISTKAKLKTADSPSFFGPIWFTVVTTEKCHFLKLNKDTQRYEGPVMDLLNRGVTVVESQLVSQLDCCRPVARRSSGAASSTISPCWVAKWFKTDVGRNIRNEDSRINTRVLTWSSAVCKNTGSNDTSV